MEGEERGEREREMGCWRRWLENWYFRRRSLSKMEEESKTCEKWESLRGLKR